MRISLEWVTDFAALPPVSPEDIARELTLKTVEVEAAERSDGDVVFEIDNKSLTNRPDLWGHYGIARELAAIYQVPLAPLPAAALPAAVTGLITAPGQDVCSRLTAVTFSLGAPAPAPEGIRRRLARIGADSISLLVDLANYVMYTTGQPLHVYDADQVQLPLTAVSGPVPPGYELLTGQHVTVSGPVPVICDVRGVAGIAGIMGGAASAVTAASRRFVLEAATFRPGPVRQASLRLGLRTEASSRFEKGLDTQRADAGTGLFLALLRDTAPLAEVTGFQDMTPDPTIPAQVTVPVPFLERRIGERMDPAGTDRVLRALGFGVRRETEPATGEEVLRVTAPSWRSTGDISLPDDVLEEVARIRGYDSLPVARTRVTLASASSLHRRPLDRALREQAALRGGLQEIITYPWTTDELLAAAGLDKAATIRFTGATAPDRDSLRPSLLPNLLEAVTSNLRHHSAVAIFEIGTVFPGGPATPYQDRDEAMPPMRKHMALALTGTDGTEAFRRLKGILIMLRRQCQLTGLTLDGDTAQPWADQTARLAIRAGGAVIGSLALVTPRARRLAGIDSTQVAYAELDITALRAPASRDGTYTPLPGLPDSEFDLSLIVSDDIRWAQIEESTRAASALIHAADYVGEYRGDWVPACHRSLTLRVTLRPDHATLTATDIANARDSVLETLGKQYGAHQR